MHLYSTVFELLSLISQNLKKSLARDHAHSRTVCNPNAKTLHVEPVQNLKSLALAILNIFRGTKNLNGSRDNKHVPFKDGLLTVGCD